MQHSLSALLFPGYRRRVLELLLLHPEETLHGREIARRTGLASGTLNRELALLVEAGLLKSERRGNQVLYGAQRACPVYEEVAGILRKTSGVVDVLAAALAPLKERIRAAFVYGSLASGRERPGSDVDLMVVGDIGFGEAVRLLHPAQEAIGREISPKVYGAAEWAAKRRAQDGFLREVLTGPKMFVIGGEHELGESPRAKARARRA
jgi:predicted nucleotidyltransferase